MSDTIYSCKHCKETVPKWSAQNHDAICRAARAYERGKREGAIEVLEKLGEGKEFIGSAIYGEWYVPVDKINEQLAALKADAC